MADLYVLRQGCVRGPIVAASDQLDPLLDATRDLQAPWWLTTQEGVPVRASAPHLKRVHRLGPLDSTETVGSLPHDLPALR